MQTALLIVVETDGTICRGDDEHGGCYFNNFGICALFQRPPPGPDADPTQLRPRDWRNIELRETRVRGEWERCVECRGAALAVDERVLAAVTAYRAKCVREPEAK